VLGTPDGAAVASVVGGGGDVVFGVDVVSDVVEVVVVVTGAAGWGTNRKPATMLGVGTVTSWNPHVWSSPKIRRLETVTVDAAPAGKTRTRAAVIV
jgi:hypothetical protein